MKRARYSPIPLFTPARQSPETEFVRRRPVRGVSKIVAQEEADFAMAQIAALGATIAFLFGYETDTWQSYAYALAATLGGAGKLHGRGTSGSKH